MHKAFLSSPHVPEVSFRREKCGLDWSDIRLSTMEIRKYPQVCTICPTLEEGEIVEFGRSGFES
jgi:hypothetical protein